MSQEYTLVRYNAGGEKFEILVDPDKGLAYKRGEITNVEKALIVDTIFTDASKGLKASQAKLEEVFGTSDPFQVAEQMFDKGTLLLTTQQRREMVEEKRRKIIHLISTTYVDPRTKLPHPPTRVENALNEIRHPIDPFKPAEEQLQEIVEKLRTILPMSSENVKIAIKVPAEYTGKAYGTVKSHAKILREEWQIDGSWIALVEVPAARQMDLLEALARDTHGNVESKIME